MIVKGPRLAFLLIGLWALAACVPTSEHPIVVEGQSTIDTRLLGTWRGMVADADAVMIFLDAREEADALGMSLLMAAPATADTQEDAAWIYCHALTAEVAGERFLSLDWRLDSGEAVDEELTGYHLFRYEIDDAGALTLFAVNEADLVKLIETQALRGEITSSGLIRRVRLTGTSAQLAESLARPAVELPVLFADEMGVLTRLP